MIFSNSVEGTFLSMPEKSAMIRRWKKRTLNMENTGKSG